MPSKKKKPTVAPRKPEATTKAAALERRWEARANAPAGQRARAQAHQSADAPKRPRKGIVQRAGEERAVVVSYLPVELGKRLRRHCFDTEQDLSAVVAEAVDAFLRGAA